MNNKTLIKLEFDKIISMLECNCACFYCYESQHHIKLEVSFDWNKVTD